MKKNKEKDTKRNCLYHLKLSDIEMAYILNFPVSNIERWRTKNKLISNTKTKKKLSKKDITLLQKLNFTQDEIYRASNLSYQSIQEWTNLKNKDEDKRRMQLYNQNLTDEEMAKLLEISRTTITMWRKRKGLPSNQTNLHDKYHDNISDLYAKGYSDEEIAKKLFVDIKVIKKWKQENLFSTIDEIKVKNSIQHELSKLKNINLFDEISKIKQYLKNSGFTLEEIFNIINVPGYLYRLIENKKCFIYYRGFARRILPIEDNIRTKLYEIGLNDAKIAKCLKLSPCTIHNWRNNKGFASNHGKTHSKVC